MHAVFKLYCTTDIGRVTLAACIVSVFGSIAVCLFPLWPPEVRLGVYYLSVAAACFVGLICVLCIGTYFWDWHRY